MKLLLVFLLCASLFIIHVSFVEAKDEEEAVLFKESDDKFEKWYDNVKEKDPKAIFEKSAKMIEELAQKDKSFIPFDIDETKFAEEFSNAKVEVIKGKGKDKSVSMVIELKPLLQKLLKIDDEKKLEENLKNLKLFPKLVQIQDKLFEQTDKTFSKALKKSIGAEENDKKADDKKGDKKTGDKKNDKKADDKKDKEALKNFEKESKVIEAKTELVLKGVFNEFLQEKEAKEKKSKKGKFLFLETESQILPFLRVAARRGAPLVGALGAGILAQQAQVRLPDHFERVERERVMAIDGHTQEQVDAAGAAGRLRGRHLATGVGLTVGLLGGQVRLVTTVASAGRTLGPSIVARIAGEEVAGMTIGALFNEVGPETDPGASAAATVLSHYYPAFGGIGQAITSGALAIALTSIAEEMSQVTEPVTVGSATGDRPMVVLPASPEIIGLQGDIYERMRTALGHD